MSTEGMTEITSLHVDLSRYDYLELTDSRGFEHVIYDIENPDAWVESTYAVEIDNE